MSLTDDAAGIRAAGILLGEAGLAPGTTGNISVRTGEGSLVTATGVRLGAIGDDGIAVLDAGGAHTAGARPTKESVMHTAVYAARPEVGAVVHLHSPAALAVSCLSDLPVEDPLPVYTPYFAMRVGRVRVVAYYPPGDTALAGAVAEGLAAPFDAVLLRNHGIVCAGRTLADAVACAEELETNCRLHLDLAGRATAPLGADEVAHLHERWRSYRL